MKLQILVPQYKESEEVVKPLLDSIEAQQNINKYDISVIIVNDGSEVFLSKEFLDKYTYRIDYYRHDNKGVSATRNACLDYATADYVMFCDADDMFFHIGGLYTVFNAIEDGGFDVLNPNFMNERRNSQTGKMEFFVNPRDCTHVHGKVFRRQFLLDNNIRWDEKLTIHEDGYFNTLCLRLAKSVKVVENPFYLWKWRKESITRSRPNFFVNTYDYYISVFDALVDELVRRRRKFDAQDIATAGLINFYFMSNSGEWEKHDSEEHRLLTEECIRKFYCKYKDLYMSFPIEQRNKVLFMIQKKMMKKNISVPSIPFAEWLLKLETAKLR